MATKRFEPHQTRCRPIMQYTAWKVFDNTKRFRRQSSSQSALRVIDRCAGPWSCRKTFFATCPEILAIVSVMLVVQQRVRQLAVHLRQITRTALRSSFKFRCSRRAYAIPVCQFLFTQGLARWQYRTCILTRDLFDENSLPLALQICLDLP